MATIGIILSSTQFDTQLIITISSFILGIVASQLNIAIKALINSCKFKNFDEMIDKSYINSFHKLLDKYSKETNFKKKIKIEEEIKKHIKKNVERLNYLKEEEISFLNTDNQFKIVRLIEFTKSYFKVSEDALTYYSFHSPDDTEEDYNKDYEERKKIIIKVKKSYKKNKKDYLNLKTDFLLKDLLDK